MRRPTRRTSAHLTALAGAATLAAGLVGAPASAAAGATPTLSIVGGACSLDGTTAQLHLTFADTDTPTDRLVFGVRSRNHAVAAPAAQVFASRGVGGRRLTLTPVAGVSQGIADLTVYVSDRSSEASVPVTLRVGGAVIDGTDRTDVVLAGAGADTIRGHGGPDVLCGGEGADTIHGGDGDDAIGGSNGHDIVHGDAGDDLVDGNAGDDQGYGGDGRDALEGGTGNDLLYGGEGPDEVNGEGGADRLYGDAGDDVVEGSTGGDELHGGPGNDTVDVGYSPGDDTMNGDGGADRFTHSGGDTVADLNAGEGDTAVRAPVAPSNGQDVA